MLPKRVQTNHESAQQMNTTMEDGRTGCSNIVPHKQKYTTGVEKIGQRRSPDIRATSISSPGAAAVNTKSFWSRVATSSVACKATRPKTWAPKKLTPKTWAQKSQPAQNETSSTMAGKAPSKAEYANFIPCWLPSDGAPLSENWRKTQICGAFLLLTHLQRGWPGLQDEGGGPWLYVRWHRGGSLGSCFHVHFCS